MSWRIFTAKRPAQLFAAAVDKRLGYPKTHAEGEYRRGPGRHAEGPPRTETHCSVLALADGTYAVEIDDVVRGLSVSAVDIDGERVTIDAAGAIEDIDRDEATIVARWRQT